MKAHDDFDIDLVRQFFAYDYRDRGMIKWQGYYLSDHTAALNRTKQEEQKRAAIHQKPAQEYLTIIQLLTRAKFELRIVLIQLNIRDQNSQFLPDLEGMVLGIDDGRKLYLDTQTDPINILEIRNVTFKDI